VETYCDLENYILTARSSVSPAASPINPDSTPSTADFSDPDNSHEIRGGVYVVAFFDVLGRANALRPLIEIRDDPQHPILVQREMNRVARILTQFRSDIQRFFRSAKIDLTESVPADAPNDLVEFAKDYQSPKIKIQGFSDTIVVYVPLSTLAGHTSLRTVPLLLISVANTMLLSFARGFAVRGAIDMSWGIEIFEGEIYGPALLSACTLETNSADWSRVILGRGIQRLLNTFIPLGAKSAYDAANVEYAKLLSTFAFSDVDGQMAVDFLGPSLLKFIGEPDSDSAPLIDAAHVTLEQLHDEASGTERHARILGGALDYFENRRGALTDQRRKRAASILSDGNGNDDQSV
jgi:hypothetical protein